MAWEPSGIISHYRLIERLGEGGMGTVWRAIDTRLDREVALKVLRDENAADPDQLAGFEREAKILASLDHPQIVTVHSIEEADGRRFLSMELVRGQSLRELMPSSGLSIDRLLQLALPVADAVAAAHAHGIVHRDLKPGNIMVPDWARPKILDFGLSRMQRSAEGRDQAEDSTQSIGEPGAPSGTPAYMSPEQLRGQPPDPRSDVFALGVVLYEMATGLRPFRGESRAELAASILRDRPRPVHEINPEMPRSFGRLVARCLEKAPDQRYPSAAELHAALETVRTGSQESGNDAGASIAVLPFADVSPEHDQEYFCQGLAEEILNAISRIENLRVASRTSAFYLGSASLDSREIGDRLGVNTLLEGSVRKSGQQLRINARLVSTWDGYQLWSESYDRELKGIFAIQEEIAQAVVVALRLRLSPRERRALKQVATTDVRAYDHYLRGRQFYYRYDHRGVEFALEMFNRAIGDDPNYALAWAGVADCHSFLYLNAGHREDDRGGAAECSRRALELDPDLAEAHAARGLALSLIPRDEESEAAFREAVRLNPRLFEAWYHFARQSFAGGKLEQAIELYERAAEVRSDDYQSLLLVAQIYDDLGRTDDGRQARLRGVERAEQRLEFNPDDVRALYMAANALVLLGERDKALRWAARAVDIEPDEGMVLYNVACIHALAGEVEPALSFLERALAAGLAHRGWIEHDSNLDPIRSHPRFAAILLNIAQ